MSTRDAAAHYARAFFDVTRRQADPVRVGEELEGFARLVAEHADLGRVVRSVGLPPARKRAIVEGIAGASGLSSEVTRLLGILADHDVLSLVGDIAAAYGARLMQFQGIVDARVTTAVPLDQERVARITRRLADATGGQVRLTLKVDPDILGGVVTQIGSVVYDGSIVRQLAKLKAEMVENA